MFNKPFKIKANSQLKGSERKKIRSEILKNFPCLTEDELLNLIPQKEMMSLTKLFTHNGESVTVYSVQKLPIVFVLEDVFYPTVYMLWTFPNLLPAFTTWPQVFPKISSGADLMLPGVVLKEGVHIHAYGKLKKGATVAINLTSNKAPIAIGVTALSSFDMYMAAKRGKAIKILHVLGDHLWALATTLTIPELGPPEGFGIKEVKAEVVQDVTAEKPPEAEVQAETPETGAYGYTPIAENHKETTVDHLGDILGHIDINEREERKVENTIYAMLNVTDFGETSTEDFHKEMDKLLLYCFLKACKTSAKKVEFPLLTSNFHRLHMLPACPLGKSIDLKKSSYKKLSKFLTTMADAGIIKLKELTKGVESIMSVDYGHAMLKDFVDAEPISEVANKLVHISNKDVKPEIIEMHTVTAAVLPMLSCYGHRKGDSLSMTTIRNHVTGYVKTKNLQSPNDKSMVNLDSTLKMVLQCPNTDAIKWEDLMNKFIGRMSQSYQITFAGEGVITAKGKLDPIDIQVGRRTGNKKVTLVNNLELYKINLQEFARECQHGVAASTSISQVPGKKSQQLLVQGNQVQFLGTLLMEKYQIPKRYIRGLENAPKSKK